MTRKTTNNLKNTETVRRNFIDIIILTETWSRNNERFDTYKINNYQNFSVNRTTGDKGGGILVYIHKKYNAIEEDSKINDDIEFLLVKIFIGNELWHILGVYRRPQSDLENFLTELEEIISKTDVNRLIVAGDFNINVLEYNAKTSLYLDSLRSLNLHVTNGAISRDNSLLRNSGSLLDHCLINCNKKKFITLTSERIKKMSDHNMIILLMQLDKPVEFRTRLIKFKTDEKAASDDINWSLFNCEISSSHDNVDLYWESFHNLISNTVEKHTKKKIIRLPKNETTLPVWANSKYQSMLHTLNNLADKIDRLKVREKPCDSLELKYMDLNLIRNEYGSVIAKLYYKNKSLQSHKEAWKVINELSGRRKKKEQLLLYTDCGETIVDELVIANRFQDKFLSIVGQNYETDKLNNHSYFGSSMLTSFVFEEVTPVLIQNIISSLPTKSSTGYDNISTNLIKNVNELASIHLSNIFNLMISEGTYPNGLKTSLIVPIHKGDNKSNINNYRPISLLPCVDKIFEKIMFGQMSNWMEKNCLHDRFQYGFRERKGCQEAIAMALNVINRAIDENKSVAIISFDIAKAFDNVNLKILMRKLYFLGFRSLAYDLIENFLTNRKQKVKYNNSFSYVGNIYRGVPQGANGGPFLFTCMINDMKDLSTHSTLLKYADDLLLILPLENNLSDSALNKNLLIHDLNTLREYYNSNDLILNCEKSKYLIIGNNLDDELEVYLRKQNIAKCDSLMYLGFKLCTDQHIKCHVDKVAKSLASSINALRIMKKELPTSALKSFYFAHIYSHLNYCSFALLKAKSTDVDRLQKLQNKTLKIIQGLPRLFPTKELFCNIFPDSLSIIGIIYLSAIVMVKKAVETKDDSLPRITRFRESARNRNLYITPGRKRELRSDITHVGCKLFNQLPENIKSIHELSRFKKEVKSYLLQHTESLLRTRQFTSNLINL
ncbi:hypothetical protein PVAND_014641 [Polypedilum vanderplanki]|uniref:Reverse transcriptase domain-containing protein n=1 Tax=Polypedilum vanderplanki TaxID=319348 RepID=A0A9J6B9S5_POLVA|nr:hypothetical protein PVAND_014641 [Polypedilum vanderplanki]